LVESTNMDKGKSIAGQILCELQPHAGK
jgi:hypothetical protein